MEITAIFDHLLTAEAIANNVDLLTEILLRVPAKSLVRFKCVSKDWLSFISDSKFSNNHMRKNLNTSISGLYIDSRPLLNFNKKSGDGLPKLDFLKTSSQVKTTILHSCNGLILCSRGQEIIVCNLTTQKFTVLPSPPKPSARISDADKFLVVNPIRLPHYKVVLIDIKATSIDSIGIFSSFYSYDIDIFSSENGIWNSKHFSEPRFDPLTRKVLCDGAIYWIADGNNLVFFDTDKDDLSANQMPPEPVIFGNHFVSSWFGEHADYLLLTQTIKNNGTQLRVLEMDMHNYSWMTKYNVNLEPIKDTLNRNDIAGYCKDSEYWWMVDSIARMYNKSADVLCFKGEDGKETLALLLAISGKIISYDLDSNSWEVLQVRELPSEFHGTFFFSGTRIGVHKFVESLASIT